MSEPALHLDAIHKSYNSGTTAETRVLEGATLKLVPGEVVGLAAPSGAGKSTLLHIAGLLDRPDSGSVSLAGIDLTEAADTARTTARRRDIGFVYQFHHLLPEFSALENVILPQLADGAGDRGARARATELLSGVGLSHRLNNRPAQLSGGEQQRVAFCRALANGPAVLLADEPTGNLDPTTSDTVFEALLDLVRSTGMAALVATHNPVLAAQMDRTLRLEGGVLV